MADTMRVELTGEQATVLLDALQAYEDNYALRLESSRSYAVFSDGNPALSTPEGLRQVSESIRMGLHVPH